MLTLNVILLDVCLRVSKIKRVVWNITAAFLFRPFITPVFRKWRIAMLRLFGAKIEWDANVYASVKIWAPWMLQMGIVLVWGQK